MPDQPDRVQKPRSGGRGSTRAAPARRLAKEARPTVGWRHGRRRSVPASHGRAATRGRPYTLMALPPASHGRASALPYDAGLVHAYGHGPRHQADCHRGLRTGGHRGPPLHARGYVGRAISRPLTHSPTHPRSHVPTVYGPQPTVYSLRPPVRGLPYFPSPSGATSSCVGASSVPPIRTRNRKYFPIGFHSARPTASTSVRRGGRPASPRSSRCS